MLGDGKKHVWCEGQVLSLNVNVEQPSARFDVRQCLDKQIFGHFISPLLVGATRFLFLTWSALAAGLSNKTVSYPWFTGCLPLRWAA